MVDDISSEVRLIQGKLYSAVNSKVSEIIGFLVENKIYDVDDLFKYGELVHPVINFNKIDVEVLSLDLMIPLPVPYEWKFTFKGETVAKIFLRYNETDKNFVAEHFIVNTNRR